MHAESYAHAHRECLRARIAAKRALTHLSEVLSLGRADDLNPLRKFAQRSAEQAVRTYRTALNKRNYEIRQLS
jgi:energy-converting hydrogenase A subunit M